MPSQAATISYGPQAYFRIQASKPLPNSSLLTDDAAVMQLNDGDLVIAYADSATNNFKAIRMVSDRRP